MTIVLLNLYAGGGGAARLEGSLREVLKRHHPGVVMHSTRSATEATRVVAAARRGSRVVLVGGDDGVHPLLPAILAGAHEMALVPVGGGDDSARALHLHRLPWPRALARALTAQATSVDIGWVRTEHEERPFFSSLAAGFDAVVARSSSGPAWLRGVPRYILATLAALPAWRLHALRIEIDGAAWFEGDALFASTLNTPSYGGGLPAVPQARVDDGQLHLLLAGSLTRSGTLLMLPRLLLGRHLGHREVRCTAFNKLQIDSATPLPLAADGQAMRDARQLTVRVGQQVLQVVAGAEFNPKSIARAYKP